MTRRLEDKSGARVFIPARNEAATITEVVRGCRRAGFPVTVIDDASADDTARLAAEAGAEVLTLRGSHHGKTAALHLALAQLDSSVEWLIFLDGDGQHDPRDLKRFWRARAETDLVVGNRLPDAARMPILRRWTNRVMSALLRRSGIRDSQCGFRLVRRAWLGEWLPAGHHFQFESEMALLAAAQPTRVVNLPIPATYADEESKIVPLRDGVNFARCLLRERPVMSEAPLGPRNTPAVQTLFKSTANSTDQPIEYPRDGVPEIQALLVEMAPGEDTGWHSHPVPLLGYLLSGELTVVQASGHRRVVRMGEVSLESVGAIHKGSNEGTVPCRMIVFVVGLKDVPFMIKAEV